MVARHVVAEPETLGQRLITGRPADELTVTLVGKAGASVLGDRSDHPHVAAIDQYVGYRFAQRTSARDGEQMRLALAAGVLDKVGLRQAHGLRENGLGDFDLVIESQLTDHARRGSSKRCELASESRAGSDFDHRHE